MVGDIFGGNTSIILYSSSYGYFYLVQFESSGISGWEMRAAPPEHIKQWQEQPTSQLSDPVQGLVKRATMSRRSARIISKSSKAVKGEEHDDEIKFQGTKQAPNTNKSQFVKEYQVECVNDVLKLGVKIDVSHAGGHCGWRVARKMVGDEICEREFTIQLGKDYKDEKMRGKIKPTPQYVKSDSLRFTWPQKRKQAEWFDASICLPFLARRYRRSLMSCYVFQGDKSLTTLCHYQKDGTVNVYTFDGHRKPPNGLGIEYVMFCERNMWRLIKLAHAQAGVNVSHAKSPLREVPAKSHAKSPTGEAPSQSPINLNCRDDQTMVGWVEKGEDIPNSGNQPCGNRGNGPGAKQFAVRQQHPKAQEELHKEGSSSYKENSSEDIKALHLPSLDDDSADEGEVDVTITGKKHARDIS